MRNPSPGLGSRATTVVLLAALLLALGGCLNLFTTTEIIEFDVVQSGQAPPALPGDPIALSAGSFHEANIDLGELDFFEEHRDEIHRVERLGFKARVTNVGGAATSFSIYISAQAGLTDPANEATLLLSGLSVPAAGGGIDYGTSEASIENLEQARDLVATGSFALYSLADGSIDLTIDELLLVLTLSVGL
jgi:hypothetical protein